jgi:hypothetical protein
MITAGKEGRLYLLDRSALGGYDPNSDHVVQSFQMTDVPFTNIVWGAPVCWAGPDGPRFDVWAESETLKAFAFDGSLFNPNHIGRSVATAPFNAAPGGVLAVSANGDTVGSGIVWATVPRDADASDMSVAGVLHAFDAANVGNELWNGDLAAGNNLEISGHISHWWRG